jgi:hypothetical protein
MSKLSSAGAVFAILMAPLSAQDTSTWKVRPDAGLYATIATTGLTKVTHKPLGFGGYVGIATNLVGTDVPVRVGYGSHLFSGAQYGTVRSTLYNHQVFGDLFFPTPAKRLNWYVGLSINRYHIKNEGTETYIVDPQYSFSRIPVSDWALTPKEADKVYRGGFRVGLTYQYTRHFAAELGYQQTELGTRKPEQKGTIYYGHVGNVNPGWFQLGIRCTL